MSSMSARFTPPFCPHPGCRFHVDSRGWRFKKKGFFARQAEPARIQRYLCAHCRRSFSSQTFSTRYWLRRPDLPGRLFFRLLSCAAFRQIGRDLGVSPTTVLRHAARLGRHCLLLHEQLRPKTLPAEPLVVDGFESFEFSQYTPVHFHLAVGAHSHFFHAFTDSELRRKGRMSPAQRRRRERLEQRFGRPDPRAIERDMADLLAQLLPPGAQATVRSDEHPAYPRALQRLADRSLRHERTPSTRPRTPHNPLFAANLLDLLVRHSSANHKRETIAFSKRRQSAAERLALLQVWRNYMKPFSERRGGGTPAQRLGLLPHALRLDQILAARLFPHRMALPERVARYYGRRVPTRRIPRAHTHQARFAF
jgi:transposase-like protein